MIKYSVTFDFCSQNIAGCAEKGDKGGKALTVFHFPKGMAYDSKRDLFIADMSSHFIRIIARWNGEHIC